MADDQITLHAALERIDVLSILLASTIQRVKLLENARRLDEAEKIVTDTAILLPYKVAPGQAQ